MTSVESLPDLANRLRALQPSYPAESFAGRGIVIVAGGTSIFTNAYVLVKILRHTLGCRLPIEVWHFGAAEMSRSMAALLVELDVDVVDALPVIAERGAAIRDGWQLKPFALMWSRFAEVLLLDADQVPVTDPSDVFDWPEFAATGAVFWPDVVDIRHDNAVWAAMGLPQQRTISFESGQVLIDKSRQWRALSIAVGLNAEAERLYRLIYGDKDTFLLAWQLAGAVCSLVPHRPFVDTRLLVQRDFSGRPLFQHRTGAKWAYAGEQAEFAGFSHHAECLAALAELRMRWNGRVFEAPSRSIAAQQMETELVAAGAFSLEIAGEGGVSLQLRRFGEIGTGRSYDRQNWWIEATEAAEAPAGGFRLLIADGDRRTYQFEKRGGGVWEGTRLRAPVTNALLFTVQLRDGLPPADAGSSPGLVDDLLRAARFPTISPGEFDRLAGALTLLARIDPGIASRLQWLVARAGDVATAGHLERLLQVVAPHEAHDRKKVWRDVSVLAAGYQPAEDE